LTRAEEERLARIWQAPQIQTARYVGTVKEFIPADDKSHRVRWTAIADTNGWFRVER
jgi:hypothetical protein